MALEGLPIEDNKPGLIWENNPDTPITATALSKASDLSVSYLDFKYNDPQNPHHLEGTIIMVDPDLSQPALKLVLKRGVVFSIINQVDEITYPNGQYKIFDTGLDDLWLTQDNKDNASTGGGWGVNKQWFIFICDERINNPVTNKNTAQFLISQSSQYPQNTQVPGTAELFSEKDTRLIGGFKSDDIGYIIRDSIWDISGKYNKIKAKKYMILDEYAIDSITAQHIYRPLRVSDLDTENIDTTIDSNLLISDSVTIGNNLDVGGTIQANKYSILDNNNTEHLLQKDPDGITSGVEIRTLLNPNAGDPIFVVSSSGNSERLRVEHDGKVTTSNDTISINGVDITKGLSTPSGNGIIGIDSNLYATRIYNAVYNDLAEYFLSRDKKQYGKVYTLYKDKNVQISKKKGDRNVIGVCSDTPAFIMKQEYEKYGGIPITLSGTVNVCVRSVIKEGNELMSDKDGFACKAGWFNRIFKRDTIIGKAMERSFNSTEKRIQILVR